MQEALLLLAGWLLGLGSHLVLSLWDARRRSRAARQSLSSDLMVLKALGCVVARKYAEKSSTSNREFHKWFLSHTKDIPIDQLDPEVRINLKNTLHDAETDFVSLQAYSAKIPDVVAKALAFPSIEQHGSDVHHLRSDIRRGLWRLRAQVDLYNQAIAQQNRYFYMTFDSSIVGANRKSLEWNLNDSYKNLTLYGRDHRRIGRSPDSAA